MKNLKLNKVNNLFRFRRALKRPADDRALGSNINKLVASACVWGKYEEVEKLAPSPQEGPC